MARQPRQIAGNPAVVPATYTGPARELIADMTEGRIRLQDGVTPGGIPMARLDDTGGDVDVSGLLEKAQNLNDLPDKVAARGHLELGGAALLDVGTGAGTVAAGNDSRFVTGTPAPGGRLTLVTGTPAPQGDTTGATSIFYTPSVSNVVPIYDGTRDALRSFSADIVLPLTANAALSGYHQVGKNFDIVAAWTGTALVIGTGPAWTSDTARGTGAGTTELSTLNGVIRNAQPIQLRIGNTGTGVDLITVPANQATYLGSFRTMADGQARDTTKWRWLFNAYNQVPRIIRLFEQAGAATSAYGVQGWRYANNNANNFVDVLMGLQGGTVDLVANLSMTGTGSTPQCYVGIGRNGGPPDYVEPGEYNMQSSGLMVYGRVRFRGDPGLGRRGFDWAEYGGTGATFYYGGCGMSGSVLA